MFCAVRSSRVYDFDTMRLFCLFIFGMAFTLSAFEVKAWTFPLENMNEQQSPQMKRKLWPGTFSVDREHLKDARVFPLRSATLPHEIDTALESE